MGAQSFEWSCLLYEGYDDLPRRVRRSRRRRRPAPARAGAHDRAARGRRPRRVLPRADRGRDRGDDAGHHHGRRPRRALGPVGRPAAGPLPRRRGGRAAAADPGRDRARGVPDRRRIRSPAPARRRRTPAPAARGDEARARRPRRARHRPRRDAGARRRPPRRRLDRCAAGRHRPGARRITPPALPSRTGGTAYLCFADADGLLVSLIQSNFLSLGSGVRVRDWGINLNNRGSSFTLDADHVNALAPSKLPMHTLIPAMALRDGRPALVFGSMGADAQAQVHLQVLDADRRRRCRSPGRAGRPPVAGRAVELAGARRARLRPRLVRRDVALAGTRLERGFPGEPGFGHAHAIAPTPGGYAVATDPRAEGAALGF